MADVATLADITAQCQVTALTTPTATVNCGGSVTVTKDATLPISAQGTTEVTWTYDDGNGNTSTQTQNVMIDDTISPVAICQNITILLDATNNASIIASDIDTGSNDNCGSVSLNASQTTFTTSDIGDVTVTLTATDVNGSINTCDAIVTVEDNNLAIDDFSLTNVTITPNPFNDIIHIKLPLSFNNSTFDIKIFDLNGRLVFEKQYSSIGSAINVSDLNKLEQATYLLKITSRKTGYNLMKRLIKF
ncbi:T9SS type A sorting domain-containing protein [Changchengzhania lutea]|uniref:T9SS type A sorting domain-containing protein n=1 Tax=Changchengzhania lutea TaxID=2049305 RepID=UPI00115C5477|nr:T9SS type A sorting domain-containing protein [Changchengzhania lutea]